MDKKDISNLQKTVAGLIKHLSARNRDIISRRFGLSNGKRETLESIGSSYHITRERVRQIEEFTLGQLAKVIPGHKEIERAVGAVKSLITRNGGITRERELFKQYSGNEQFTTANATLAFILGFSDDVVKSDEDDSFQAFWAAGEHYASAFRQVGNALVSAFGKSKRVVPSGELHAFAGDSDIAMLNGSALSEKHLTALLAVSKDVTANIFGEIGLVSWPEIRPKGVRDKAYVIMKKAGEPRHFGDIARLINDARFSDAKKVNIQTVHNELIKDPRFVLVGRGMYALSEWGYKSGTVKDVLTDILKNSSRPLAKTELIAKVLDARMVKENTIVLNLQDSSRFIKRDDGTYDLRKA